MSMQFLFNTWKLGLCSIYHTKIDAEEEVEELDLQFSTTWV